MKAKYRCLLYVANSIFQMVCGILFNPIFLVSGAFWVIPTGMAYLAAKCESLEAKMRSKK